MDLSGIKLDRKQPDLLYHQLAQEIGRLIGQHSRTGEILPSVRELSRELKIHRATVQKAYEELLRKQQIKQKSPYRYQVNLQCKRAGEEPFAGIGIILPCRFSALLADKRNIGAEPYIKGIIDSAMENKLSTVMLELPAVDEPRSVIDAFTESLTKRLVGLVHLGGRKNYPDPPLEAVLKTKELPQVFIAGVPQMENVGVTDFDAVPGATALAEQFHALNHHRIGLMLAAESWDKCGSDGYFFHTARVRDKTIRNVLENYGLDCDERFHCFHCLSYREVRKQIKEKIQDGDLPSAYFCHNDEIAHWTIHALHDLGYEVPKDISVVGFNGLVDSEEELTTISLPFYAIGHRSVKQLLDYYENGISERNRFSYLKTFLTTGKTLGYAFNKTL